jgi:predicted lipid-binding transport protein (Tim44 family)
MRHLIGSILAITIAGVAAVAATTALLNAPLRTGRPASAAAATTQPGQSLAADAEIPDAPPPKGASAPAAPAGAAPAVGGEPGAAKPTAEGEKPDESDTDPYEGIAPEELPPDLQYDADASVSFPTNT